MNKKNIKKSRDEYIKCAIRARKNNHKEKEKQFMDLAVALNNLLNPEKENDSFSEEFQELEMH